jgi:very-short-patch-repair endonuclease
MKLATLASRKNRRKLTKTETVFWNFVRNRQFKNLRFRRQHPIEFVWNQKKHLFVADFYCAEFKLIVELDGEIHRNQKEYDRIRDNILKELNYKVMRFENKEIEESMYKVLKKIGNHLGL